MDSSEMHTHASVFQRVKIIVLISIYALVDVLWQV